MREERSWPETTVVPLWRPRLGVPRLATSQHSRAPSWPVLSGWRLREAGSVDRAVRGPTPAALGERPASRAGQLGKSLLDKVVAGTAIVLTLPLMATIAAAIRWSDGGPAIYGHERVGANGRMFRCYKFRTMVVDGDAVLAAHLAADPEAAHEWAATRKLRSDPRVTRIGRFLRRASLDELPQFFNVLSGEMSCVGPRPVVAAELTRYGENAADYLSVKPGITGLWQVSGRSNLSYAERVELDALYVRRWSLWLDILILTKTIPAVLRTGDAG